MTKGIRGEARALVAAFYASERLIGWQEAERDALAGRLDHRDEMRVALFILCGRSGSPDRVARRREILNRFAARRKAHLAAALELFREEQAALGEI